MAERYPGYDVLAKRSSPSWNEQTRRVIDQRLALPREPRFLGEEEWSALAAICDRIVPQPERRPPIPVASLVDRKLADDLTDGYRNAHLPPLREAWRRGLRALDAEAMARHGRRFDRLAAEQQDALLRAMQQGEMDGPAWAGMPSRLFFEERVLTDIVAAYYAHPTAWNEIGFGGPASPRGYVRLGPGKRDPWEAAEGYPGREDEARRSNLAVGKGFGIG